MNPEPQSEVSPLREQRTRLRVIEDVVLWAGVVIAALNLLIGIASLVLASGSPLDGVIGAVIDTTNPYVVGLCCALVGAVFLFADRRPARSAKVATLLNIALGVLPIVIVFVIGVVFIVHGTV